MNLEIFIHRDYLSRRPFIEVKGEDISAHNIWRITMYSDIRIFSPEELEGILLGCRMILDNMHFWETPLDFRDIVDALEDVLSDLGIHPSFVTEKQNKTLQKMGVPDIDKLFLKRGR